MKKVSKLMALFVMVVALMTQSIGQVVVKAQETLKVAIVQLVSHPSLDEIVEGVKNGLADAGYKEGDNLEVEFHNAEGDMNLLGSIAETVVNNKPDLIFAVTTPVAQFFADATKDIPIILTGITDPVGAGLVESIEKPGGNITGVSDAVTFEQQFDLLKEIKPDVKTLGMLYTTNEDSSLAELKEAEEVAKKYGIESKIEGIDATLDMQLVAENLAGKVDAIFVGSDNTIASAFETLLDATDAAGIPIFTTIDVFVKQGALSAVAIKQGDIGVQAAAMGVEVLNGKKPAEMPIQFVEKLQSVVNLKTAEHLNIELSDALKEKLTDLSGE
ncbi:ABC transporter substrate-binding protein [Aerococcaceae bacterium zg-ZJ1578]|uniref:ABC transporter substrate binding protein n=1 Tax=Aerococcaceae bacterium zg-252 TaxID=2796928 RepID=UPI001A201AB4|nr:ABC transporter substrate-binding protein [Aerococcaceae bacterium zg-1578]